MTSYEGCFKDCVSFCLFIPILLFLAFCHGRMFRIGERCRSVSFRLQRCRGGPHDKTLMSPHRHCQNTESQRCENSRSRLSCRGRQSWKTATLHKYTRLYFACFLRPAVQFHSGFSSYASTNVTDDHKCSTLSSQNLPVELWYHFILFLRNMSF